MTQPGTLIPSPWLSPVALPRGRPTHVAAHSHTCVSHREPARNCCTWRLMGGDGYLNRAAAGVLCVTGGDPGPCAADTGRTRTPRRTRTRPLAKATERGDLYGNPGSMAYQRVIIVGDQSGDRGTLTSYSVRSRGAGRRPIRTAARSLPPSGQGLCVYWGREGGVGRGGGEDSAPPRAPARHGPASPPRCATALGRGRRRRPRPAPDLRPDARPTAPAPGAVRDARPRRAGAGARRRRRRPAPGGRSRSAPGAVPSSRLRSPPSRRSPPEPPPVPAASLPPTAGVAAAAARPRRRRSLRPRCPPALRHCPGLRPPRAARPPAPRAFLPDAAFSAAYVLGVRRTVCLCPPVPRDSSRRSVSRLGWRLPRPAHLPVPALPAACRPSPPGPSASSPCLSLLPARPRAPLPFPSRVSLRPPCASRCSQRLSGPPRRGACCRAPPRAPRLPRAPCSMLSCVARCLAFGLVCGRMPAPCAPCAGLLLPYWGRHISSAAFLPPAPPRVPAPAGASPLRPRLPPPPRFASLPPGSSFRSPPPLRFLLPSLPAWRRLPVPFPGASPVRPCPRLALPPAPASWPSPPPPFSPSPSAPPPPPLSLTPLAPSFPPLLRCPPPLPLSPLLLPALSPPLPLCPPPPLLPPPPPFPLPPPRFSSPSPCLPGLPSPSLSPPLTPSPSPPPPLPSSPLPSPLSPPPPPPPSPAPSPFPPPTLRRALALPALRAAVLFGRRPAPRLRPDSLVRVPRSRSARRRSCLFAQISVGPLPPLLALLRRLPFVAVACRSLITWAARGVVLPSLRSFFPSLLSCPSLIFARLAEPLRHLVCVCGARVGRAGAWLRGRAGATRGRGGGGAGAAGARGRSLIPPPRADGRPRARSLRARSSSLPPSPHSPSPSPLSPPSSLPPLPLLPSFSPPPLSLSFWASHVSCSSSSAPLHSCARPLALPVLFHSPCCPSPLLCFVRRGAAGGRARSGPAALRASTSRRGASRVLGAGAGSGRGAGGVGLGRGPRWCGWGGARRCGLGAVPAGAGVGGGVRRGAGGAGAGGRGARTVRVGGPRGVRVWATGAQGWAGSVRVWGRGRRGLPCGLGGRRRDVPGGVRAASALWWDGGWGVPVPWPRVGRGVPRPSLIFFVLLFSSPSFFPFRLLLRRARAFPLPPRGYDPVDRLFGRLASRGRPLAILHLCTGRRGAPARARGHTGLPHLWPRCLRARGGFRAGGARRPKREAAREESGYNHAGKKHIHRQTPCYGPERGPWESRAGPWCGHTRAAGHTLAAGTGFSTFSSPFYYLYSFTITASLNAIRHTPITSVP
ncbi:hypothetical protein C7M84_013282 [Penaeus vannamei]|uniref:Uncharacterized protein n=1 Tax=Penaeus vannamei TaxID=6689 RepID=A0A3R7SNK2_PENVA|nr:hypothetical protein C7M84_013282 [Penaeus vannamei]